MPTSKVELAVLDSVHRRRRRVEQLDGEFDHLERARGRGLKSDMDLDNALDLLPRVVWGICRSQGLQGGPRAARCLQHEAEACRWFGVVIGSNSCACRLQP